MKLQLQEASGSYRKQIRILVELWFVFLQLYLFCMHKCNLYKPYLHQSSQYLESLPPKDPLKKSGFNGPLEYGRDGTTCISGAG